MLEIAQEFYLKINNLFNDGVVEAVINLTFLGVLFFLVYQVIRFALKKNEIDNHKGILSIIKFVLFLLIGISVCSELKCFNGIGDTLLASGGMLAIVFGIAAQDTFGNLFSGLMIMIYKPFKVGDLIKVNGEQYIGFVEEISLRHTVLNSYENNRYVISNSVLNQATIENANLIDSTKGNYLKVTISYESDMDLAIKIIKEECIAHPLFLDSRTAEEIEKGVQPVDVKLTAFADNGIVLRTIVNSKNSLKGLELLSDLRYSIKKRFDKEGIEIPYPHTTIIYKEKEPKN